MKVLSWNFDQDARESFSLRLREWWQGAPSKPCSSKHQRAERCSDTPTSKVKEISPKVEVVPQPEKIGFGQDIWGEGFLGPGGVDYVAGLAKPLNPTSKDTMLMLSAELGGPAQVVTEAFGVWVSAFESSSLITELGMSPAVATDLDRKVDLQFSDFEKLQLPERKFAYALWKEGLFRVSDKQRLLNSVYDSLKPGGGLVITDFVTPKRGYTSPEVQDWVCSEPVAPTLWSAEETLEVLNSLKFRVPIHEDISMEYQRIVIDAWKRWLVLLPRLQEEGKLDAQFRSALMSQLTYWVHRANLIETGELRLFRYFALKPEDSLASLG